MITKLDEYINENKQESLDSKVLYNKLLDSKLFKYVDRPSDPYAETIDTTINDIADIDKIKILINKYNWYISKQFDRSMIFKPKYSKAVANNKPTILYHATPTENLKSILKSGLKSKTESVRDKYPPRIYVTDNLSSAKSLMKELKRWSGKKDYSILEIDTSDLDLQLYLDLASAYNGSYYLQNVTIPPKYIKEKTSLD
jgi:hypothetical protein